MMWRNVAIALFIIALIIGFFWFTGLGKAVNPFILKLNVKVTGGVDCIPVPVPIPLGYVCYFNQQVTMEYKTAILALPVRTFAWWCGPAGGAKALVATLTVVNPDLSTWQERQEQATCEDRDLEFFFVVPLDKGKGEYKLTAEVCGDTLLGWRCVEKTATYVHGGYR